MTPDVASAATPGGLQGLLLWIGVAVGAATCAAIFFVTVRHRLRTQASTGRDRPTQADRGRDRRALLAEVLWVLTPMLMIIGLGWWVVAEWLAGRAA